MAHRSGHAQAKIMNLLNYLCSDPRHPLRALLESCGMWIDHRNTNNACAESKSTLEIIIIVDTAFSSAAISLRRYLHIY